METKDLRALDAQIAEKAMEFRWFVPYWKEFPDREKRRILLLKPWADFWPVWGGETEVEPFGDWDREVPHYSSNISDAFRVVEKMRERGFHWNICSIRPGSDLPPFGASFAPLEGTQTMDADEFQDWTDQWYALGETAPLAICLAALKAIEQAGARGPEARDASNEAGGGRVEER